MANELKFIKGSSANWDSLEKNIDNIYFVLNDDNTVDVYMGGKLLSKGTLLSDLLSEIARAKEAEAQLQVNIETEQARAESAEKVLTDVVATEVDRATKAEQALSNRIQTNVDDIEVLNGDVDVQGSVRQIVNDAVVALVDAAPEALDTLKEIADWIARDETLSADLLSKIEANTLAISTEQSRAEAAEQDLSEKLSSETDRAEQAEQSLKDELASEVKKLSDDDALIRTELADADAEVLQTSKDYTDALETKVDNHINNYNSTVQTINNAIANLGSSLNNAIVAEQTRAETAEQLLADNLASETNQRKSMKGSGNVVVELSDDGVQTVKFQWLTF